MCYSARRRRASANVYRVDGGRERYAAQQDQQIAQGQAQYVNVRHVDHVFVPDEDHHQRPVADDADEEYEGE